MENGDLTKKNVDFHGILGTKIVMSWDFWSNKIRFLWWIYWEISGISWPMMIWKPMGTNWGWWSQQTFIFITVGIPPTSYGLFGADQWWSSLTVRQKYSFCTNRGTHTYACSIIHSKNPPCIAHYKVDILCAYKVGFRSPLYIPTMGDKAVFCARNMPLDLEDDFIATLAFQFIPGWFPTRKRLNICGNAFYRPLVPFKEWP